VTSHAQVCRVSADGSRIEDPFVKPFTEFVTFRREAGVWKLAELTKGMAPGMGRSDAA
jgi:hypothetical protein